MNQCSLANQMYIKHSYFVKECIRTHNKKTCKDEFQEKIRKIELRTSIEGRKSLAEISSVAYEQVIAPYHGWASSDGFILSIGLSAKAVIAAMERLPSSDLILQLLNEDEESVKEPLQKYVTAAKAVLQYVDNLFLSSETGAELLRLI
ncbi:hypothetical protein SO802_004754 [Lithocarpus litseifolius]|uniref:Glycolipid transfer protein domain-containing protein n=1 Tax=Lithocarpus litseifolius TaxID=425828 RepID=A0AAW2DKS3_9ROSI